jgi:twitching motility protein PilT
LVHIVTIEDPIEFLLNDGLASVTQREVGADTPTFESALRNALRQDPDVIMVGENRDLNTMSTTLTAAETGHVVFTTLHTNSAAQTIDRIIDMFPAEQHRQVRQQLSQVLKAVISMHLVERADGQGLVAAIEILRDSPRTSKLIKDGNIADLHEEIERSVDFYRMQSMNQSLAALVIHGVITRETAIQNSTNAADLDLMLRKFFFGATRRQSQSGEEQEMPSDADYSRIHKLLEIEKLYDDLQERHHQEVHDRDQRIRELQHELRARTESDAQSDSRVRSAEEERDRAARAVESQRVEFETQIQRLQARIRELQSTGADPAGGRGGGGGLFRR